MKKIIFREEQKFTGTWISWLIYGVLILNVSVFGYGFVKQIILGETWGNKPIGDIGLIIICIVSIGISGGLIILFQRAVLKTTIHDDGIDVAFPPFFSKKKSFSKDEIKRIEIRKYNPVKEYGGWGVRVGLGKGRAYNVKGNLGIQLYFENGKNLLIGTQKKDQAEWAVKKMKGSDL